MIFVRKLTISEIPSGFEIMQNVFYEFVAPGYSNVGIETFESQFLKNTEFQKKFQDGREEMYGAFCDGKLVGILSVSNHNTVSCVFVKKEYHRQGIATRLFIEILNILKSRNVAEIKINASPYAIPFYHAIGFHAIGKEMEYKGIIYTPMKMKISR